MKVVRTLMLSLGAALLAYSISGYWTSKKLEEEFLQLRSEWPVWKNTERYDKYRDAYEVYRVELFWGVGLLVCSSLWWEVKIKKIERKEQD